MNRMNGKEVAEARDVLGLSQETLAKEFGLHKRTVEDMEKAPHKLISGPMTIAIRAYLDD